MGHSTVPAPFLLGGSKVGVGPHPGHRWRVRQGWGRRKARGRRNQGQLQAHWVVPTVEWWASACHLAIGPALWVYPGDKYEPLLQGVLLPSRRVSLQV